MQSVQCPHYHSMYQSEQNEVRLQHSLFTRVKCDACRVEQSAVFLRNGGYLYMQEVGLVIRQRHVVLV